MGNEWDKAKEDLGNALVEAINGPKVVNMDKKPNEDAIEILESAIERVKSGELVSVGLAWVTSGGGIGGDISRGDNNVLMFASLEHSARSFYNDVINVD